MDDFITGWERYDFGNIDAAVWCHTLDDVDAAVQRECESGKEELIGQIGRQLRGDEKGLDWMKWGWVGQAGSKQAMAHRMQTQRILCFLLSFGTLRAGAQTSAFPGVTGNAKNGRMGGQIRAKKKWCFKDVLRVPQILQILLRIGKTWATFQDTLLQDVQVLCGIQSPQKRTMPMARPS